MIDAWKALLASRKFLLTLIAVAFSVALVIAGRIEAKDMMLTVSGLVAVLVASIAYENPRPPAPPS